jgi:hypothetical protein
MRFHRSLSVTGFLVLSWATIASAQDEPSPDPAGTPPKMPLLVHQGIKFGKARERQRQEIASARAYDQLKVPIS